MKISPNSPLEPLPTLLLSVVVGFVATAATAGVVDDWLPPARDTSAIVRDHEETFFGFGLTWELDFYRNPAYACGLSGNYTFLIMEPFDAPGSEAPLWVYLHGGGVGYFDGLGGYPGLTFQDENTWHHEETFDDLWNTQILGRVLDGDDQQIDNTLSRRIAEGYRVLVVSMCDHDLYSGLGTPYPNNPVGGEVNGLEATMAAVDYTVASYPTTHVFAHGTSAGSYGVWSLSMGHAAEQTPITGIVADSTIATPRLITINEAYAGTPGYPFDADFDDQGATDKIGFFADPNVPIFPEDRVSAGFADTPSLFVGGSVDPFCSGQLAPIAEAAAEGLTNCEWVFDGLAQAVDAQPNSPHQVSVLAGTGHVPTNRPGPANDIVDVFVADVLATDPPYPFGEPVPEPGATAMLLAGAMVLLGSRRTRRSHPARTAPRGSS